MTDWRLEWVRDWAALWDTAFETRWSETVRAADDAHAYQLPAVVRGWSQTCSAARNTTPMIGFAEDGRGNRVVLPLVVSHYRGRVSRRRILEYAGNAIFGYHDPLLASDDPQTVDWRSLWQLVREQSSQVCDEARLRFVRPCYLQGVESSPCHDENPVLELAGLSGLDELLARCSSNHRGDVRRRLRRCAEQGCVELWVAPPEAAAAAEDDFVNCFLPAYQRHRERYPDRYLFNQPGVQDFTQALITDGVRDGWGHYSVLRLDGQSIAWHIGFMHAGELLWWIPVYDPDWASLAPGKVLMTLLVEHGIGAGWRRMHLLTGGHPYKLAWKPKPVALRSLHWHSSSLRGRLLSIYDAGQRLRSDRGKRSKTAEANA